MIRDSKQKLSAVTIALHWLIGTVIIIMLGVGWAMERYELLFLYANHKSVGILIFAVVLVRVWWRAINGFPEPLGRSPKWWHIAVKISHWILLIGSILMPISGATMSALGGHGLEVFGLELLAHNIDPLTGKVGAYNEVTGAIAGIAHRVHHIMGQVLMVTVGVHILAALKHHWVDRDNILLRMLGRLVK